MNSEQPYEPASEKLLLQAIDLLKICVIAEDWQKAWELLDALHWRIEVDVSMLTKENVCPMHH